MYDRYGSTVPYPESYDALEAVVIQYHPGTDETWLGPVLVFTVDHKTFYWNMSSASHMTLHKEDVKLLQSYGEIAPDDYDTLDDVDHQFVQDYPPRSAVEDSSGWLAPDGTFYPCEWGGHTDLEVDLVKLHYPDAAYGFHLHNNGWCRVDAEYIEPIKNLTSQQLNTLMQLYYLQGEYLNREFLQQVLSLNGWDIK